MFCFSKTCRICKRSTNSFTLTCNSLKEVHNLFFSMFPELMNSQLNHLLKNLCVTCMEQLLSFENFKNHCLESDLCYMRYLNQLEDHDCKHAELVCKLGIKQEDCQIQPTFDGVQEDSSYYGSAANSSSTAEDVQIDIVKQEISMTDVKEENESAMFVDAISRLGCEESGSEEIRDPLALTNQESLVSEYHRCSDMKSVAVNENDIAIKLEPVELSSNGRIEDFHSKLIDDSVDTRVENGIIKLENCQGKDNLSNITEDDITKIDIVKHEVCVADKEVSSNVIGLSVNNNESQTIYSNKLSLNHQPTYTGEKPYQCDDCKKSFWEKYSLMTHIRTHTGEKPYECDVCKRSFSEKGTLITHKRTHTGEKPYQCDICKKNFSRQSYMIVHKRTHTGEKPYNCEICKKSFSQKIDLMRHIRTHTGEKPFECDLCKKSFSYKQILIAHKRTHTGEKPYMCDVCNMSFSWKTNLDAHKRTHTGEKPYWCDLCENTFSYKKNLIDHLRTHTGEKPYECDICKKVFARKGHMIKHQRTHTGEKPYECDICKKSFSGKSNLNTHKRTHTGGKSNESDVHIKKEVFLQI